MRASRVVCKSACKSSVDEGLATGSELNSLRAALPAGTVSGAPEVRGQPLLGSVVSGFVLTLGHLQQVPCVHVEWCAAARASSPFC
jgi:hypothetical protein